MPLRVSGKNLDVGESLRQHVIARVDLAVAKYFDGAVTGHVTLGRDGSAYRADCTLHLSSGVTLQAEGRAHEPYASFEQAAERIEKRLRRYKRRLKDRHGNAAEAPAAAPLVADYVIEQPQDEDEIAHDYSPLVIAESTTRLRELSVADAVADLDLSGAPVGVFRHAGNGRINVVYRRADGNIGWIDPGAAQAGSGARGG
ncbi:MAG: ribosome-associated translation inhibitor RaiA [Methylobacteriaceae bacterium]|nr:ribosome-associated translation inhibitor RaiA [Methylobacteriaceae bacterium]